MSNLVPEVSALRKLSRAMRRFLPAGHDGAVIVVTPTGRVACHHNMDPVKLAIVLGKLTEDLVREAKQPIFEEATNG